MSHQRELCSQVEHTPVLDRDAYWEYRNFAIFDCMKRDPQVGDQASLAPCALVLNLDAWRPIAEAAGKMHAELVRAEEVVLSDARLLKGLGLPIQLVRALGKIPHPCGLDPGPRVMRFDFHPTEDGWKVSEVNSDVPGGLIESAALGEFFIRSNPSLASLGDPATTLARAFRERVAEGAPVALVHATAYSDDRQQMEFVAHRLREAGLESHLTAPDQIVWSGTGVGMSSGSYCGPIGGMMRFFPAEWLPNLGRGSDWEAFFRPGALPTCNPGRAIVSQSKAFPLVCARADIPLPVWRSHCPEVARPREVDWRKGDGWIVKPCLGRVGEGIGMREAITPKEWKQITRAVRWNPRHWIAQRRFKALPLTVKSESGFPDSPSGLEERERPAYLCLGVFTIDGAACGAYGRISRLPLIDQRAQDVPILIRQAGGELDS